MKDFKLQNGDIILVHNYSDAPKFNGLPWLIQINTRRYYHHCAQVKNGKIVEAIAQGVCESYSTEEYSNDVGKYREIAVYRNVPVDFEVLDNAIGSRYAFEELLFQLWNQWFNYYPIKTSNLFRKLLNKLGVKDGYTCSTLTARFCKRQDWRQCDPQDLQRDLKPFLVYESRPKRREWIDTRLKGND
jgi:hypothetical protein